MFFYTLAGIAALIWLWGCLAYYGSRRQWSRTLRYGGTFGFAVAALAVAVAGYQAETRSDRRESAPGNFDEAGLTAKKWTPDQLRLAAAVTARKLTMLRNDLEWAASLDDQTRARILADELSSVATQWKNQDLEQLGPYQACLQAATALTAGFDTVLTESKTWPEAQFKDALGRCEALR